MTNFTLDAEAATTVDVALTSGNLAIQGGAASQFVPSVTGTGTIKIRNAASAVPGAPLYGTKSYHFEAPVTADSAIATVIEAGTTTTQKRQRVTMYHPAAPTGDQTIMSYQGSAGSCMAVIHRTTGRIALVNANAATTVYATPNDSTGILTYPCTITYDTDLDVGTTGSLNTGDGKAHLNVYLHSFSTSIPWNSATTTAENNNYYRTGYIASYKIGKNSSVGVMNCVADAWSIKDGLGLQGTIESATNTAPTVAIPSNQVISKQTGQTFSFTATAADPDSDPMTYLWANDTRPASAAAPTLTGTTTLIVSGNAQSVPGIYTVKFKANDGALDSLFVIGTAYYAAADGTISVRTARGSTFTGAISLLNDGNIATVVTTPNGSVVPVVQIYDMNPVIAGDVFTLDANALAIPMRKRAADGVSDTSAVITIKVEILTGPADTVVTATDRIFTLTNTMTTYIVKLTAPESAAFTDHNLWAIRFTETEG